MSPILDQSPDTNTGTAEVLATATADTSDPKDMGPAPIPSGYHARIYDLSAPYCGASRVIVSRLRSGNTIVVGPVEPGAYSVDGNTFIAPLADLGDTESLVDALARMGYTAT